VIFKEALGVASRPGGGDTPAVDSSHIRCALPVAELAWLTALVGGLPAAHSLWPDAPIHG
jgi:hypothetical protein